MPKKNEVVTPEPEPSTTTIIELVWPEPGPFAPRKIELVWPEPKPFTSEIIYTAENLPSQEDGEAPAGPSST